MISIAHFKHNVNKFNLDFYLDFFNDLTLYEFKYMTMTEAFVKLQKIITCIHCLKVISDM